MSTSVVHNVKLYGKRDQAKRFNLKSHLSTLTFHLPASHVFYFDSSPKCLNQSEGELYVNSAVNHDDGDDDGDDDFSFQEGELLAQWADNIHFLFF